MSVSLKRALTKIVAVISVLSVSCALSACGKSGTASSAASGAGSAEATASSSSPSVSTAEIQYDEEPLPDGIVIEEAIQRPCSVVYPSESPSGAIGTNLVLHITDPDDTTRLMEINTPFAIPDQFEQKRMDVLYSGFSIDGKSVGAAGPAEDGNGIWIFLSSNQGKDWAKHEIDVSQELGQANIVGTNFVFWNENEGWFSMETSENNLFIYTTSDSGATWTLTGKFENTYVPNAANSPRISIAMTSAQKGWLGIVSMCNPTSKKNETLFFSTEDGGKTWTRHQISGNFGLEEDTLSAGMISQKSGLLVAEFEAADASNPINYNLYRIWSSDEGSTWHKS